MQNRYGRMEPFNLVRAKQDFARTLKATQPDQMPSYERKPTFEDYVVVG